MMSILFIIMDDNRPPLLPGSTPLSVIMKVIVMKLEIAKWCCNHINT